MRDLWAFPSRAATQIALAAAIALVVRLILLRWRHDIDWDGFFYLWQSQNILMGDFLHPSPEWTPYPLGYPLAIAVVSKMVMSLEGAGLLVSFLAGVLVLLPLFALADRIGGRGPAFLATLLVAVNSWLVRYSLSVLAESLFILLLVIWVWLLVADFRDQRFRPHTLLLFLISAALVFVRPVALTVLAGGVLLQAFRPSRRLATALRFALMGLVIAVAYAIYAHAVTGHLQKLTGQPQPSYALREMSRGLQQHYGDTRNVVPYVPPMSSVTFLRKNALLMVWRYVDTLLTQLSGGVLLDPLDKSLGVFPFYLWPFAAVGIWMCASERWRIAPLIALLPYFLVLPLFVADCRYYVPLVPFFLLYSAVGVEAFAGQLGQRARVATIVGIILISFVQAFQFNPHKSTGLSAYEEIGSWLRQHERPDTVFAYHPAPAYYAGASLMLIQKGQPVSEALSLKATQRAQRTFVVAPENEIQPHAVSLTPVYASQSAYPSRMIAYRVEF